jgi:hypothetical protein
MSTGVDRFEQIFIATKLFSLSSEFFSIYLALNGSRPRKLEVPELRLSGVCRSQ